MSVLGRVWPQTPCAGPSARRRLLLTVPLKGLMQLHGAACGWLRICFHTGQGCSGAVGLVPGLLAHVGL